MSMVGSYLLEAAVALLLLFFPASFLTSVAEVVWLAGDGKNFSEVADDEHSWNVVETRL